MMSYGYGLLLLIQFFSIVPISIEVPMTPKHIERAIRLLPVLGMGFGVLYSLTAYVLHAHTSFSPLLTTFFVWLSTIVWSGGIHLDGWMDSADAYFSYQNPEKRRAIMEDPRVGAFGVLGIVVLLTAKFVFIYEVIHTPTLVTFWAIFLIPVLSRMLMGLMLVSTPSAKDTGLGHLFQAAKTTHTLPFYGLYVLSGLGLFFVHPPIGVVFILFFSITSGFFFFVKQKAIRWFGGITGDVIGAATEGLEVVLWLILLLLPYFGMG